MAPNFKGGLGLIDSDEYVNSPNEVWTNQNNFYRQVRNFIIDTTRVPANQYVNGIHWQVAQGTSLTNIHFKMSKEPGNQHKGVWMENGSGGFMSDLTFEGGKSALEVGNQQFTSRNITISDAETAIHVNWTWGWTFKGIKISNCKIGEFLLFPLYWYFRTTRVEARNGLRLVFLKIKYSTIPRIENFQLKVHPMYIVYIRHGQWGAVSQNTNVIEKIGTPPFVPPSEAVYRPSHKKLNGTGGGALPLLHSTGIELHSLTAVADDATLALS